MKISEANLRKELGSNSFRHKLNKFMNDKNRINYGISIFNFSIDNYFPSSLFKEDSIFNFLNLEKERARHRVNTGTNDVYRMALELRNHYITEHKGS